MEEVFYVMCKTCIPTTGVLRNGTLENEVICFWFYVACLSALFTTGVSAVRLFAPATLVYSS